MSYGIECYGPDGTLMFGTTDGLWRLADTFDQTSAANYVWAHTWTPLNADGSRLITSSTTPDDWLVICEGSSHKPLVNTSTGTVTVYANAFVFTTLVGNRAKGCILTKKGNPSSSNNYGFRSETNDGSVQIDNNYSNWRLVGGGTAYAPGTNTPGTQTAVADTTPWDPTNELILVAPSSNSGCITRSTTNTSGQICVQYCYNSVMGAGVDTTTSGGANYYEWRRYKKHNIRPGASGYGMNVYNSSGELIFTTDSYLLNYIGTATFTHPQTQAWFQKYLSSDRGGVLTGSSSYTVHPNNKVFTPYGTTNIYGWFGLVNPPGSTAQILGLNYGYNGLNANNERLYTMTMIQQTTGMPNTGSVQYGTGEVQAPLFQCPAVMPTIY